MEDVEPYEGPPNGEPSPEAGHDPDDPLRPEVEEEDATRTPPLADPHQDMDVVEDKDELSDNDSDVLSEVDEAQFEDFDPANIAIDERPAIAVDESNVALIGVHRRKKGEVGDDRPRKKKEKSRREKPKKNRKKRDRDDDFEGGEEIEGKRVRKSKDSERRDRPRARRPTPEVENEDHLTPEERRKRALDRAMDEALKNPNKRKRRKDGIDLSEMADAEIEDIRRRMAEAAQADTEARKDNRPAMHKLRMLPEVVALLNRNTLQASLVDPDINLLEAVRFFLEPLDDGSLPAYNIQRDLFAALAKLPITKDALVASGIGKVTLFYTKSPKPEPLIKRQAERLLGEWTRPILKRSDDYRKRVMHEVEYDQLAQPAVRALADQRARVRGTAGAGGAGSSGSSQAAAAAAARQRALATPMLSNRARMEGSGLASYSIAPRNTISAQNPYAKPMGASSDAQFRRLKARQLAKGRGGR
ncbi:MAG: Transcription factor iws1 [Bathelium mastoideum]|nr:MAG: Transcription factor iws1 [Bathelium mastoideum]